ncbi:cytochrome c biogenesis protein CcsA [Marinicrinis sediminis]|uniref:Cytochrome c biogenesis protein CcsA n=1 Tax=Marinicrinis sediminis TaxID=1652465 RepID=A0ABW5RCT7_9BACL
MNALELSNGALVASMLLYISSFFLFVFAALGKSFRSDHPARRQRKWSKIALTVGIIGFVAQLTYFIARWIYISHTPLSNLFEYMTFLSMMIVASFFVIYALYRTPLTGVIMMPLAIIILGYAAVFPWDPSPLEPALDGGDKLWLLRIHVSLAAAGEAFFAIGFAGGLMYLLRTINYASTEKKDKNQKRLMEFTLFSLLVLIGFIVSNLLFSMTGYEAVFKKQEMSGEQVLEQQVRYTLPPISAPSDAELDKMDSFLGMTEPLFEAPSWMKGINAGRKLNTVIWSVLFGLLLYGLARLIVRKPLGAVIQPILKELDPDDLDEISYRAIALGFPIFTLGALIFAMIWAHIAWGRFWNFDPKETWALVTWLFYSAYLHFRLSRGWQGTKSSWLAVLGFVIVFFTLVGVNLLLAGLHSYAGV